MMRTQNQRYDQIGFAISLISGKARKTNLEKKITLYTCTT